MKRYIWSPYSRHYHDRQHLTERCNTDQLKHRRESDEPPARKNACRHCGAQEGPVAA